MTPFDGPFANSYVLPLAIAAYVGTTPPSGFARTWEITASAPAASDQAPRAASLALAPPAHLSAYRAMIKQPKTPVPPERASHTESLTAAAASAPNLHFGWVCADTDRKILTVAIRGTQYFEDWLKDFDFVAVPYKPVAGSGWVHQGFQVVYYSIRDQLLALVKQAREDFPSLRTLLITGHSLGAAVVGLASPDLVIGSGSGLQPLVYTFAEPRGGHPDYKKFFDATVPVCYRTNNFWDIVPHFPPILATYEHEGQEVVINSGFSLNIAHNHELATGYVPGIAQWVKDHPATHATALSLEAGASLLVGVSP